MKPSKSLLYWKTAIKIVQKWKKKMGGSYDAKDHRPAIIKNRFVN